jgi:transaldolase
MPGTADSRIAQLRNFGQSPWLDYLSRDLVARGGLRRMVERDGLGGVTSNPAIFEKAIGSGTAYDEQILALAHQGLKAAEIFDRLAINDVRAACDILAPAYLRTGGEDGFVSIEVSPLYAYDTSKTIAEAERLYAAVDRPNVMIKIPGTRQGIPAILEALNRGLNINITLLFSMSQYEAVAETYIDSLEYRLQHDLTIRATSSVASFFVSRVDTLVDTLLDQHIEAASDEAERRQLGELKGRAAVANSKLVYERFRTYLNSREWQLIAASGAKIQRVLWASTSTKNAAYPDLLYVDELIGEHTVNTMPEATWKAFNDHGTLARSVGRHLEEAHRSLRELSHLGIDMERVGAQLQTEGVDLFNQAYRGVIDIVDRKRAELLTLEVG